MSSQSLFGTFKKTDKKKKKLWTCYWIICSSGLKSVFVCLSRTELDACDSPEKYPQLFHVLLDIEVESTEKQKDLTPPWEQFPKDLSPNVLFSCHQEHQDALAIAGNPIYYYAV